MLKFRKEQFKKSKKRPYEIPVYNFSFLDTPDYVRQPKYSRAIDHKKEWWDEDTALEVSGAVPGRY